jgi:hypothetical protein
MKFWLRLTSFYDKMITILKFRTFLCDAVDHVVKTFPNIELLALQGAMLDVQESGWGRYGSASIIAFFSGLNFRLSTWRLLVCILFYH